MNTLLTGIVSHTPVWVWFLLAALVALGLKQSRDQVIGRTRLLVLPTVLALMSLAGAASAFGANPLVPLSWAAGLAVGLSVFTLLKLPLRAQALPGDRFAVGGSWLPLALLLGVFTMRYAVGATLAIVPGAAAQPVFVVSASLLYGLMTGVFAGRALRILAQAPKGAVPLAA